MKYPISTQYLFIKWFIVFAAILAAVGIVWKMGLISLIVASDISHLSSIIAILFVISSFLAGKLCYDISNDNIELVTLKKRMKILNFAADSFFTLGLLGTVIGFCYMMSGGHSVFAGGTDNVAQIIQQLKIGASTKLYATLSGIVCSLLLQVQILLIDTDLINE